MMRGKLEAVDPRTGCVGEWLFAPPPEAVVVDRPLADGLLTLADRVMPCFEECGLCVVTGVALRPIGGPDATYASLKETIAAVDSNLTSLPSSEASIEVDCTVVVYDGEARIPINHGAMICWRWIGEPVIQVKIYCDAFLPNLLDGTVNPLGQQNRSRLETALQALQTELKATVEIGDDEMPWTTAQGFLLDNRGDEGSK